MNLRFRDELQYRGNRHISSLDINHAEEDLNFNSDGSMDKYMDYLPCMDRGYFDRFSDYDNVVDYQLTYSEIVYRDSYTEAFGGVIHCGFALVGGQPENYIRNSVNGLKIQGSYLKVNITNGKNYGRGECIISDLYAESNGINIGDTLTFDDNRGNDVITLKVAGIYEIYDDYQNKKVSAAEGSFRCGSTPFYRYSWNSPEHALTQHIIYCSFEDSYYAFGDENTEGFAERHNFNKYIASYKLSDIGCLDDFIKYSEKFNADENLGFYEEDGLYKIYSGKYEVWKNDAALISVFAASVIALAAITFSAVSLRDRYHDLYILWCLGFSDFTISLAVFLFYYIAMALSSVFAHLFVVPVKRLCELIKITFWNPPIVFAVKSEYILKVMTVSVIMSFLGGISALAFWLILKTRKKHEQI